MQQHCTMLYNLCFSKRLKLETMMYESKIKLNLNQARSFSTICKMNIADFPADGYSKHYDSLLRGRAILKTKEQCNAYMACYSDMHVAKLNDAYNTLFHACNFRYQNIEVVDWGCGQALATCTLHDYLQSNSFNIGIRKSILIEPSSIALSRGGLHVKELGVTCDVNLLNRTADGILRLNPKQTSNFKKVHLFSNILDMGSVDLDEVYQNIKRNFSGENYFVCVSPLAMNRLEYFFKKFKHAKLISRVNTRIPTKVFRPSRMEKVSMGVSRCQYIFKVSL